MRWLRFAILVLLVTVLQTSLVDIIAVTNLDIKPNLLLILLVFFSIHCDANEVIITSFTIGFAADIIGPAMGPQIISFGLFGTLLADLRHVVAVRKMPHQALAIFATGFATTALARFLIFLKAEPGPPNIYTQLFWTPLYSAVLGPFLFLPSAWWMRIRTRRIKRF
jgi:rod shape-determining protein MreD